MNVLRYVIVLVGMCVCVVYVCVGDGVCVDVCYVCHVLYGNNKSI